MPDQRSEHPSSAQPVSEYVPGGRALNPSGLSKGVRAVPADHIPPAPRRRRPPKPPPVRAGEKGRPVGSKNRPPPTQEMFDAPPDGR
jgi:hypothetical protein